MTLTNWTAKKYPIRRIARGIRNIIGKVPIFIEAAAGENAMSRATAPTEKVEAIRGIEGRDCRNGIFPVRATWMMRICESDPNINQPAQKRGMVSVVLKPKMNQRTPKHKISKIEEVMPAKIMKVVMERGDHLRGFFKYSLSTLSRGKPRTEKSASRF